MKKSFTLLEVIISISLFLILIIFLYKTLDQTKHTNNIFEKKKYNLEESNNLNSIFVEDFAESFGEIKILFDRDKNTIVKFKSNNTFHNPFYNNITYLIGSNSKLIRIESKDEFKQENTLLDFYENSYIDILLKDIDFFEVSRKNNEIVIVFKEKNKKIKIFKAFRLGV